jgi:hypothetical protein
MRGAGVGAGIACVIAVGFAAMYFRERARAEGRARANTGLLGVAYQN